MKLMPVIQQYSVFFILALAINVSVVPNSSGATLSLSAVISDSVGLGCQITVPDNVIQFTPLQVKTLVGVIKTYQIKPLTFRLSCVDETEELSPLLTLQGVTPYTEDTTASIFLDGTPNGVGFMVRQSADNSPIALADFYRPDIAIPNNGVPKLLTKLNTGNHYQSETVLWVGIVGPLTPAVVPGNFQAALTLNVAFQ